MGKTEFCSKNWRRKLDREWCLAALGGADRLAWFRETFRVTKDFSSLFDSIFSRNHIRSHSVRLRLLGETSAN